MTSVMSSKSLTAYPSEQEPLGFFRIFATPPGGYKREITLFRGAPVQIGTVTTQDPFTEVNATLTTPQITLFDSLGQGDLDWVVPDCDIDIVWQNMGGYSMDWRWEGYIAAYDFSLSGSEAGLSLTLKGALYGLDDYLAMPTSPRRPIPYEILIAQAFDQNEHPAHLGNFRVLFPQDWALKVPSFKDKAYETYFSPLKPWGVATGTRWTGFTSRSTGSWEPMLTGFVQSLLTVMFAEGGAQWSIRNRGQRRPELYLRQIPASDSDQIVEIYLGAPGVTITGSRDFTQRAGVMYGMGHDEAGITFSNVEVTPDGKTTYFKPFAYSARMWPRKGNPNYDKNQKPKEALIRFQDGVDEISAFRIAQGQYQRFAEPGITGTITLTTDPRLSSGELMPRLMIRGGQTIRINGLFGIKDGVLAHVTQAVSDFTGLTTTLTFDTKYRDQLTVEEVRARTRDALTPLRWLQVGKYSNQIQDLVIPWSYKAGSGIIPTPARTFFTEKLPTNAEWPYEEWTKRYPPKDYPNWYVKIGPTDTANSTNNWSARKANGISTAAIQIRMSEAGSIRLSQLAAYDRDGKVLRVKFHFSLYKNNGTAADSMPRFPLDLDDPEAPKLLTAHQPGLAGVPDKDRPVITTHYKVNQPYPFYENGWESKMPDGSAFPWSGKGIINQPDPQDEFVVGWGNYFEPAGYYPGRFSGGQNRTGLFQDDTAWSWSWQESVNYDQPLNQQDYVGMMYVMIYCEDQGNQPVYFMGRLIRSEPGQS